MTGHRDAEAPIGNPPLISPCRHAPVAGHLRPGGEIPLGSGGGFCLIGRAK